MFSSKDDRKDENETYISAIESIEVIQKDGILFTYIKGPCFHRYQVRFMVGAAVEVATGRSSLESIKDKLSGIGVTGTPRLKVPGKGLVLDPAAIYIVFTVYGGPAVGSDQAGNLQNR